MIDKQQTAIADVTRFLDSYYELSDTHDYDGCGAQILFRYEYCILDHLDVHLCEHNISSIKFIESFGEDGEGNQYWHILEIRHKNDTSLLVKLDGYYTSYIGSEYSEWFFVKPIQVMVTQYVKDE